MSRLNEIRCATCLRIIEEEEISIETWDGNEVLVIRGHCSCDNGRDESNENMQFYIDTAHIKVDDKCLSDCIKW